MAPKDNHGPLIVEPPSQIRFSGPFINPVVTTVTLINPTDDKIIFKIKTTAPSFYGVRPNFGVVQPRNFVEVEIARQPFNYDHNEKINHKFMVQSLSVPTNAEDLNKLWENADPSQLNSKKLRCVFEMPTSISQVLPRGTTQTTATTISNRTNRGSLESNVSFNEMRGNKRNSVGAETIGGRSPENRTMYSSVASSRIQKPNIDNITPQQQQQNNYANVGTQKDSIGSGATLKETIANSRYQKDSVVSNVTNVTAATNVTSGTFNSDRYQQKPSVATSTTKTQKYSVRTYDNRGRDEYDDGGFSTMQLDSLKCELYQLKTENETLRKENNMLRSEIECAQPGRRDLYRTQSDTSLQQTVPLTYVITSVTIAILSIFIGKYFL